MIMIFNHKFEMPQQSQLELEPPNVAEDHDDSDVRPPQAADLLKGTTE